jgi:hypothetical protein
MDKIMGYTQPLESIPQEMLANVLVPPDHLKWRQWKWMAGFRETSKIAILPW